MAAGTEDSVPQLDLALRNPSSDLPELDRDALEGKHGRDVIIESSCDRANLRFLLQLCALR